MQIPSGVVAGRDRARAAPECDHLLALLPVDLWAALARAGERSLAEMLFDQPCSVPELDVAHALDEFDAVAWTALRAVETARAAFVVEAEPVLATTDRAGAMLVAECFC